MKDELAKLLENYSRISRNVHVKEGILEGLEVQANTIDLDIGNLKQVEVSMARVQQFFHTLGTAEQERLQKWMEQLVTYGLQTVFGSNYSFRILGPEISRNEVVLTFEIVEKIGDESYSRDPYTSMGGGIADVLSFLLQFLIVFLLKDRIQPILFLDEGFKHLAANYTDRMCNLLVELVSRTSVQIMMVTHNHNYLTAADVGYRFERDAKGATQLEKMK